MPAKLHKGWGLRYVRKVNKTIGTGKPPPPRTLDEWVEGCKIFKKVAPQRRAQGDSYSFFWTFRAAMIAERAAAGSKRLGYSSKNTTDDISEAFLD